MASATKKYYDELNIFRAIVIIWVIIGHSFDAQQDFPGYLHHYAYSFHMKAFFILSGLLFAAALRRIDGVRSAAALTGKRFVRIMVPYFFFTAVSYVLKFFLEKYANNPLSHTIITDALLGRNNPNGGLWFLYTLFWLNVLAILLHRLPAWLSLLLSAVLFVLRMYTGWLSYPIIGNVSAYAVYFFLGLFLAAYYEKISVAVGAAFKKHRALMTTVTLLLTAGSFAAVYFHFIGKIHFPFNTVLFALANTAVAYLFAWLLSSIRPAKRFTMTIGKYGMDIYMLGYYVQITLRVVLMSMLGLPYAVYSAAMCICGLLVPIPISKYIIRKFRITRLLVLGDYSKKEVKQDEQKA